MNKSLVIWVIVGLAVVGLLVFLVMRGSDPEMTGTEVPLRNEAASGPVSEDVARATARADAAAELATLRIRAEAGETYADLSTEVSEIRANLAAAYANAEGNAQTEWTEFSAAFDSFEAEARVGTSNFLDAFGALIDRISTDVRVETGSE